MTERRRHPVLMRTPPVLARGTAGIVGGMGAGDDETLRSPSSRSGTVPGARSFGNGVIAAERYRVDRFIASGGMGEVYAARDLVLGLDVALKTLRPELEGSATATARLRREIALARAVTDPHVCRLYDVGEHAGCVFLTMELLHGETLAEHIARGGLPIAEVERIARGLVAGLGALHRAGIVHRDFKPSNVIVAGDRPVITDFGLARTAASDSRVTTADASLLGTPAYMAPEQVEARPATPATDIYALGVVLFEMLTGDLPFAEDTPMATAAARLHRDPPKPSSRRARIPARWDAIVLRCLARDPAARFPSVDEVLDVQPTRRWFVLAAVGGGAAAAASLVGLRACVAPANDRARTGALVVLPVAGVTKLSDDPWRLALTLDVHDQLVTIGVPLVAAAASRRLNLESSTAVQLLAEPDPIGAALALHDATAVVQTSFARRTASEVAVEVTIVDGDAAATQNIARPLAQASQLAHDVASAVAERLGLPTRLAVLGAVPDYERYGEALSKLLRSRTTLDELVEIAEAHPRAAARVADKIVWLGEFGIATIEILARAERVFAAALAVDPDRPLVHAARGHAAMMRWRWAEADRLTASAYDAAPNDGAVAGHRGFLLAITGRFDEAIAITESAFARDPKSEFVRMGLAWNYYYGRRFGDVVGLVESTVRHADLRRFTITAMSQFLAASYFELGRNAEALALADRVCAAIDDAEWRGLFVPIYAGAGRLDRAKELRASLAGGDQSEMTKAQMADAVGDLDEALDILEHMVAHQDFLVMWLKIERFTPALRSHPRFQKLLATVGLG